MTRLLLDTPLVLWWLNDDQRLPEPVAERLQAPEAEVFVSQASLWEMADQGVERPLASGSA